MWACAALAGPGLSSWSLTLAWPCFGCLCHLLTGRCKISVSLPLALWVPQIHQYILFIFFFKKTLKKKRKTSLKWWNAFVFLICLSDKEASSRAEIRFSTMSVIPRYILNALTLGGEGGCESALSPSVHFKYKKLILAISCSLAAKWIHGTPCEVLWQCCRNKGICFWNCGYAGNWCFHLGLDDSPVPIDTLLHVAIFRRRRTYCPCTDTGSDRWVLSTPCHAGDPPVPCELDRCWCQSLLMAACWWRCLNFWPSWLCKSLNGNWKDTSLGRHLCCWEHNLGVVRICCGVLHCGTVA